MSRGFRSGLTALGFGRPGTVNDALDERVRPWVASSVGHDFRSVRVHQGPEADQLTQALGARALTVGNDIAFGPGEISPALMAHELAHVALGHGRPIQILRKTKGEEVVEKARTNWLDPDAAVKA